jgi:hypothetical protein
MYHSLAESVNPSGSLTIMGGQAVPYTTMLCWQNKFARKQSLFTDRFFSYSAHVEDCVCVEGVKTGRELLEDDVLKIHQQEASIIRKIRKMNRTR